MNDFYIITTDGELRYCSTSTITNANNILTNIARAEPVLLPNFPQTGYTTKAAPTELIIGKKLDFINVNTHFAPITLPSGGSRIHPVFYNNGISIHQTMAFTPPPGHEFWFFVKYAIYDGGPVMQRDPYMCWHVIGDNIYRPPFSNTYEDGRICMGPSWDVVFAENKRKDTITAFNVAVDFFQEANSNQDLTPPSRTIPLLMWNPAIDGMPQDNQGFDGYSEIARSVSNHVFDKFFNTTRI